MKKMIGVYRNLIPQAMDWSRYFPCEIDKSGRFSDIADGHDRALTK
jgi:hypothetical protein